MAKTSFTKKKKKLPVPWVYQTEMQFLLVLSIIRLNICLSITLQSHKYLILNGYVDRKWGELQVNDINNFKKEVFTVIMFIVREKIELRTEITKLMKTLS